MYEDEVLQICWKWCLEFLSMQLMKTSTHDITYDKLREIGLQSLKKNHSLKQTNVIQIGGCVILFALL